MGEGNRKLWAVIGCGASRALCEVKSVIIFVVKSEMYTCAATGLLYSGLQPLNEHEYVHMSYEQLPDENTIRLTEIEPS
jgi:hypothetical protein